MTNTPDTRPTVSPIEGHYAMLRNGMVVRPVLDDWPENPPYFDAFHEIYWERDGRAQPATKADLDVRSAPLYDIIATISPAAIEAAIEASGLVEENERLRADLDIWKSVFPDIAPENVLPDRSTLEAENARLREALRLYGDRIAMAKAPPHLQQEIDTALAGAS